MKISVVIPCYNYAEYLRQAVESVLNQTHPVDEIIIVDDFSTDVSVKAAEKLVVEHEKVRLLKHNINKGGGASRNTGISKAKGEYILLLDADDMLHKDYVKETFGLNDIVSTNIKFIGTFKGTREFKTNPKLKDFKTRNQIVNTTIFKKEIWQKLGGFDESLIGLEDWHFWLKAVKAGYKVTVVQKFLSYYRKHNKPSRNNTSKKYYKELKEYILNNI